MNPLFNPKLDDIEEKFRKIHERRIALEAEFSRVEKEYQRLLLSVAQIKDKLRIKEVEHKIQDI